MAIVLIEGFDHFSNTTTMAHKGWRSDNDELPRGSLVTGRYGGRGWQLDAYINYGYKRLPATYTTLYLGFSFYTLNLQTSSTWSTVRLFGGTIDGGVTAGTTVVMGRSFVSGTFYFVNSAGTQLGGEITLAPYSWHHMQIKVVVSPTAGELEVRMNGDTVPVISVTGVNTGSTPIQAVAFGYSQNGPRIIVDDVWACDTVGSTANGFLGDVRVETIYPVGDGSSTDWTRGGTDSGANWSQVDENAHNSDTDYVASMSSNTKDLYAVTDLSTLSGTVYGVQMNVSAKKDDAGMRKIQLVSKSGASESTGPDIPLSSSYILYSRLMDDKPGGTGWTIDEVNAAEFGMKVSG